MRLPAHYSWPRTTFPFYRFRGTHRSIGRQYGEACRRDIHRHLDLAIAKLADQSNIRSSDAMAATRLYRGFVREHAEFLDEEIQGVADGAGLPLEAAYLLQLRAELHRHGQATAGECTTYAAVGDATATGSPLVGQNADLPEFYTEVSLVLHLTPNDGPEVLMLTPAGQVSYIGINDQGLGVFGNFLNCEGWRAGFPRYLGLTPGSWTRVVDYAADGSVAA